MLNIGIGGTLTFNAGPGLAGMKAAASAFDSLDKARERFSANLAGLGQQFAQMNLITAGFGIAGVAGISSLIKSGFEAKQTFEDLQIVLGSTLGISRHLGFQKGFQLAGEELTKIEQMSFRSPTNAQGLISIYKQIAPPLSTMGAGLEQIRNMTLQSSIAAKALGFNMDDIGFGLARIIGGISTSHDILFRQMKNTGLVRRDMEAEELNALDPAKRMALVQQILKRYGEAAKTVGESWSALTSAIGDISTKMRRVLIDSGLYKAVKRDADAFVSYYETNEKTILAGVQKYGMMLIPLYNVLRDAVLGIVRHGKVLLDMFDAWGSKLIALQARFHISDSMVHSMAVHAAQAAMAIGTIIPLLSLFSLILGPGLRLISTLWSGLRVIIATIGTIPRLISVAFSTGSLLPFIASMSAIVLLFLALRKDGEGFGETVQRIWLDYIKPFAEGFAASFGSALPQILKPLQEGFDMIKESVIFLIDYLSDTFVTSSDSARDFGGTIGNVAASLALIVSNIIGFFGKLLGATIYTVTWMIYWFKQVVKYLGEGLAYAVGGVVNIMKGLVNALTWIPRTMISVIASMVNELSNMANSSPFVSSLMMKVGLDPDGLKRWAVDVHKQAEDLKIGYDSLDGFSNPDETPDEEVLRKREARLSAPRRIQVDVNHKSEITANIKLNDKTVAQAVARHQVEIGERAGAKTSPWQRRMSVTHAANVEE